MGRVFKSARLTRAGSRSEMSTNMASQFVKFVFRKNCVNFSSFQKLYRLNRRPFLPLCDVSERIANYAGVSFDTKDFSYRHASDSHSGDRSKLPHLFAVLGVVCGASTDNQEKREEKTAICEVSQDVTSPTSRPFNVRSANGRFGHGGNKKTLVL